MKKSVKLTLRMSEIRSEINKLDPGDATLDKRRELLANLDTVEAAFRAALTEEAETETRARDARGLTPEEAERRELADRSELRAALHAIVNDRALGGAEAELQAAASLSGNMLPWDMIAPRGPALAHRHRVAGPGQMEERVDAATVAPTNSHLIQHPILGRVFARSATATLGVAMPMVPVGDTNYPVITAGSDAAILAKDASVGDASAATITANTLSPKRLQVEYIFRREDAARLMGLEEALRVDMSNELANRLDAQVLAGAGTGENIAGFLATPANGGLAAVGAPVDVTYALAAVELAKGVDGIYAGSEGECSVVIGDESYRKLASEFETGSGESATGMYRRLSMKTMASANVPDATNANIQDGVLAKMGAAGANAICPIWNGVAIIKDEVSTTLRKAGQISVTALMLADFKVLRTGGFQRLRYKIA